MKLTPQLFLLAMLATGAAHAHGYSCHMKNAAGVLVPEKTLESKTACKQQGGQWTHPRLYCYVKNADGQLTHRADLESRFACERQKGMWEEYDSTALPAG